MLFTSALDVTAIYASSAFFAYFFSMILLKQPLSRVTLGSIFLAFSGVLVISLADDGDGGGEGAPRNRTLGDLVMLLGMSATPRLSLLVREFKYANDLQELSY